jgi:hypothetical protein
MAKQVWQEMSQEAKLQYVYEQLRHVKQLIPLPDPFQDGPAEKYAKEQQATDRNEQLANAHKRIMELETHKEETDTRIKQIMAHSNKMANQMATLEKMVKANS